MNSVIRVMEIVAPIFVTVYLGIFARKTNKLTEEASKGLQQFVMSFCLPCVLFTSCLTGNFGMESVTVMALVMPLILLSSVWSFSIRKKKYPYHNLPQIFSSQETGMLGIPLFITLFGTAQAYKMGVLDVAQSVVAIPVIAILSTDTGKNPSASYVIRKVFRSPLLQMSILGLAMNLTGAMTVLNHIGVGGIITEVTAFLSTPVSAVILFCVGYNFSLEKGNLRDVMKICALHFIVFSVFCAIIQAILCFVPNVDIQTRLSIILYCALPGSYLTASLGRTNEDRTVAANVCSVLTIICLVIFCIMAVAVV